MPLALRFALLAPVLLVTGAAVLSMPQAGGTQIPPEEEEAPPPARTVVIDPGHGGDDRGATGPSGVEEKQVALALAHRVRALGTARGLRVLLTRDDDRQVTLMQRAAFANGSAGIVFISLHANASPSPRTSGPEIGSHAAPPAVAEAPDERLFLVPLAAGGARRVALVPWESAQARHAEAAAALARQAGERLARVVPLGPRGVYRSALRPLAAINVPAILVDVGYLSNPDEEQLTAAEPRQAALAQAVVDAALAFDPSPAPAARTAPR